MYLLVRSQCTNLWEYLGTLDPWSLWWVPSDCLITKIRRSIPSIYYIEISSSPLWIVGFVLYGRWHSSQPWGIVVVLLTWHVGDVPDPKVPTSRIFRQHRWLFPSTALIIVSSYFPSLYSRHPRWVITTSPPLPTGMSSNSPRVHPVQQCSRCTHDDVNSSPLGTCTL